MHLRLAARVADTRERACRRGTAGNVSVSRLA